jgi:O-antigen/teichoic acid export membrane protein
MLPFSIKVDSAPANLAWATSVQVIEKLAGYAVIAVLTRTLLPQEMGKMFFAATVAGIAATAVAFGSEHHLIRAVAAQPHRALENLAEVLSLRLQNLAIVYVAANLLFWLLDPALAPVLLLISAYAFVEELFNAFSAFFTGQKRLIYRLVITSALKILTVGAVSLVAYLTRALQPILLTYLVLDLLLVAVTYLVVRRDFGPVHLSLNWRRSLGLMRASLPFFLFNILTIVHLRLGTLMVGFLLSLVQVAFYDLGLKLLEVARFAIRPVYSVSYPILSGMAAKHRVQKLRVRSLQLVAGAFAVGILITLGMELLGSRAIVLLFGAAYAESVTPARILFLSMPFVYVHFVLTMLANALHMEKHSALLLALSVALNLGLNIYVIPRYGIIGAAWITLASQGLLTVALLWVTAARLFSPEPV